MSIEPLRLAIIGTGRRADYLYSLLHREREGIVVYVIGHPDRSFGRIDAEIRRGLPGLLPAQRDHRAG